MSLTRRLRQLLVLLTLLLLPAGMWAEDYPITIAGVQVTDANAANVLGDDETPTVVYDAENHKLTLNGASIGQITYSGTSNLTIAFGGTCSITTEQTYAIQYVGSESARPKLTFSLTNETGSLSINGESLVIEGFSDVDFGSLNLASTSAQGVYYDTDDFLMRGHDNNPSDLTITTETYHPIWIYDPSLGQEASHTQLNSNKLSVAFGEGTISFDGNHTITMNNVDFNYEDNTLIVVGPGMEELTVNLVGTSTVRSGSIFLSLWATTPLTFTTSESAPGSLTGSDIVSWNIFGNGQISYENGLVSNNITDNKVVIAKPYNLWVNGTQVTSANSQDILSDDATYKNNKISFDGDHTLTLHNIPGTVFDTQVPFIKNGIENLTIFLDGQNEVNCGVFIEKETDGGDNFTATFVTDSNAPGLLAIISNTEEWYTGHTLECTDPLSLNPTGYTYTTAPKALYATTYAEYDLTIAGIPVTSANAGGVTGDGISGTVTYNATDRILTLNSATISTNDNNPSPIIVCNGDLTVNLVGEDNQVYFNGYYGTYVFKNNGATGILTFTGDGFLGINTDYDEGTYFGLCDGFSTVDFGDLAYTINGDSKKISPLNISTPMMNVFEGKIDFQTDGYLFGSTTYYKIVYADGSGDEEEIPLTNSMTGTSVNWSTYNEKVTISELTGPCTVYAYTKYKEETGASAKAKLFGPAAETQRIVCGEATSLELAPAIEEGDGIKINGIDSAIEFDEETQKITASGLGSETLYVSLQYVDEEYTPGNTIILNSESLQMQVEVVRDLGIEFVGSNLWASYYSTEEKDLAVPEGLTAYVVSAVNEKTGVVNVEAIDYIPAYEAILLQREENGAASGYTAGLYTDDPEQQVNNLLVGSAEATDISSIANSPVYVLFNDKFKRATSGTIPARRAYLPLSTAVAPSGAPRFMNISIGDGSVTAIKTVAVDDKNDSWYTIDGLKLNGKPQRKGLYINNGKKVYINNNK